MKPAVNVIRGSQLGVLLVFTVSSPRRDGGGGSEDGGGYHHDGWGE